MTRISPGRPTGTNARRRTRDGISDALAPVALGLIALLLGLAATLLPLLAVVAFPVGAAALAASRVVPVRGPVRRPVRRPVRGPGQRSTMDPAHWRGVGWVDTLAVGGMAAAVAGVVGTAGPAALAGLAGLVVLVGVPGLAGLVLPGVRPGP